MKKYNWRKNFSYIQSKNNINIKGKIAVKTKETYWIDTDSPIVIPISIYSRFHEGIPGTFKMHALIATMNEHVKGKKTILFTEMAHLKVRSLKFQEDMQMVFEQSLIDAHAIIKRFEQQLVGYKIAFWHEYICQDPSYPYFREKVTQLYEIDPIFREMLSQDAESTYLPKWEKEYPNKPLYIEKAREDILEQCIGLLVQSNKHYKYSFYPGSSFKSVEYANKALLEKDKQIEMILIFISIEKKIYLDAPSS